jgi:succinate dehydrogenase/fumarate reductase flavoprotein subunit
MAGDATWGSEWDDVVDVVVVGSGAAGFAAAVTAAREGASVVLLERGDAVGGTTAKSGGGFWVPDNPAMRAAGLEDSRDDALRYMARLAFPALSDPDHPTLGLPDLDYELLATFYDRGAEAIDALVETRALFLRTIPPGSPGGPDYHADMPENKGIGGRSIGPVAPEDEPMPPELLAGRGLLIGGSIMIETMRRAAVRLGVDVRVGHHVVRALRNDQGEVVGVEARVGRRTVLVGARRGVVFGSGGFLLNDDLARQYLRGPVFGGCAAETNEGDFVRIGIELGAQLGNMTQAWWDQTVVEVALRVPSTAEDIWYPFGDSMIQVNKYGQRVVNEKQVYNERGQVHFHWNAGRREYSNLVLFQIWDDAVAANPAVTTFRGLVPMPGEDVDYVISADSVEALAAALDERLATLASHTGGVRLDPDFVPNLRATIERFNHFAETGVDEDFGRGTSPIQIAWQGEPRPGVKNPCMAPIDTGGRLHAMIVGAGALDTKGGPRIDTSSRVLDTRYEPIPGLYGAGNCIASPMAQAYPGAGGTIGPALVFGYLAGLHVAKEPEHSPSGVA